MVYYDVTVYLLLFVVLLLSADRALAHRESLILNGNFTSGAYPPIDHWELHGILDYIPKSWNWCPNGGRCLDLLGTCGVGSISQVVDTVPGKVYKIKVDTTANNGGSVPTKLFGVRFGDQNVIAKVNWWTEWRTVRFFFKAKDNQTKVTLYGVKNTDGDLCYGVLVTNIRMVMRKHS